MKFFITLVFFVAVTSATYAQRIVKIEYDANFKPHAVVELYNDNEDALPATVQSYVISPIGKVQSISQQGAYTLNMTYGPDLQRCYSELRLNGTSKRKTIYGGAYEKTTESGVSREFYYLDGNVIVVKQDGVFTPYLAFTDNLGSALSVVDSLGSRVFWGNYRYTENKIRKEHGIGWRRMY